MTDIRFYAYISTGKLSAMHTLWTGRDAKGVPSGLVRDNYICNLTARGNDEEAERKARDYCERMSDRMGVPVNFDGFYDEPRNQRVGKLSVRDTLALQAIERGEFPFGKHTGRPFADVDDGYIMYWADKHADASPVISAIAAACMGVAMERDLIAKRDAARAERAERDAQSQFVGTIGERRVFTGLVEVSFFKQPTEWQEGYHITKVRCGDDLIVYFGNKLAEKSETITFKATIQAHCEYQGVKSTKVNRPKVVA